MTPSHHDQTVNADRYARQVQFAPWGTVGQARLRTARVLLCGCGALGSVIAGILVRAGIGTLRIVDRDFLELNNLQRQNLYNEQDVASGLPKAILAARHLTAINRDVVVEPIVADLNYRNMQEMLVGVDAIADGSDNFETRFLLNDAAFRYGIPWVYGGCLGAEGQTLTIVPGKTACFRCLIADAPPPGSVPTCDTSGILAPIIHVIGAWQSMELLKLVSGNTDAISGTLSVFDLWDNQMRGIQWSHLGGQDDCPTCGSRDFEWLEGRRGTDAIVLCGRNSVQIAPKGSGTIDLVELAKRLPKSQIAAQNPFLVRFSIEDLGITVFADGRGIVTGTNDPITAKAVFARYVGM